MSAPLLVGLTATADRGDGVGLLTVFDGISYSMGMLEGIDQHYLVDISAKRIRMNLDLSGIHSRGGDFIEAELAAAMEAAHAPETIRDAYIQHATERKALVFVPSRALAHESAECMVRAGVAAEAADGAMSLDDRRAVLRRFETGLTRVLVNCMLLVEGYDSPSIDCVIFARPTQSRSLFVQMLGRGTRPWPGKRDLLVLDLVGSTSRHELVSVPTLFGLPPDALAQGRHLSEAIAAKEEQEHAVARRGALVAEAVDLFRGRRLRWVQVSSDRYALAAGAVTFILAADGSGERWRVLEQDRVATTSIAEGLSLGYAMGVAEDRVRILGATTLADPQAGWRARPATPKQLATLRRLRVDVPGPITAGDASDAITRCTARRRWAS